MAQGAKNQVGCINFVVIADEIEVTGLGGEKMQLMKRFKHWANDIFPFSNRTLDEISSPHPPAREGRMRQDLGLVKSRPMFLEDRYQIVQNHGEIEVIFDQLREKLVGLCDSISSSARSQQSGRVVLRQVGVTNDRRPYVFMKPMSESGWLVEMGPAGWRVSQAEQIISREMFMRSHNDPWDVATVWKDPKGIGLTRVQSQRFGRELMTVSEYERRVCEAINAILSGSLQQ